MNRDTNKAKGACMSLIEAIERYKLMVAVRTSTPESAFKAAKACIDGGVNLLEITFSVPDAEDVIGTLNKETTAHIGAGTILSVQEAKKAIKAGASYIVSPNFDKEIVSLTKKEGLISIPGACTPTEIYSAHRAGGDIIKLFPFNEIGGIKFLKVIRGPLPFVRYMLCGGITVDNVSLYLAESPACILIGSAIVKKDHVMSEDWKAITEESIKFVGALERLLAES
jgi:2-dehydro-3-deoxyphosphogluconate aldolase/(4S)-4-hydroxy-2-oxoglutarate aldolase